MAYEVARDDITGQKLVGSTEVDILAVEVFILVTYQSVNVVLAEVLVVREQLLGVDDAAGIGLETEAALTAGTSGDTVHIGSTTPVLLVHVEVDGEVEVVEEVNLGKEAAGPVDDILTLHVGAGDIHIVAAEVAVGYIVLAERRPRLVVDIEDVALVVGSHSAVFVHLIDGVDGRPTLDMEHGVTGGTTNLARAPLTCLCAGLGVGVTDVGAYFQPLQHLGIHIGTAAVTTELTAEQE